MMRVAARKLGLASCLALHVALAPSLLCPCRWEVGDVLPDADRTWRQCESTTGAKPSCSLCGVYAVSHRMTAGVRKALRVNPFAATLAAVCSASDAVVIELGPNVALRGRPTLSPPDVRELRVRLE